MKKAKAKVKNADIMSVKQINAGFKKLYYVKKKKHEKINN